MRKIVSGLFISLDGVMESPDQWHFPYWSDELGAAVASQLAAADTLLLGRLTYQEFARYWPHQGSDVEGADSMNRTLKLVVDHGQRRGGAHQAEAAARQGHRDQRQRHARAVPAARRPVG
jgi:dihydrofolate reductase